MEKATTIFLVDDDEDDRLIISEAIQSVISNVRILEVSSGMELLELLNDPAAPTPDLITLDMNMPGIDGLGILKILKQEISHRHIPIVMMSTTSERHLISEAYRLGVNAFIVKPVTPTDYEMVAQAVNLCFLNHFSAAQLPATTVASNRAVSIIVIEDNEDHWNLMNFALKQSWPNLNLVRLRNKNTTLDFLSNCYKSLSPAPQMILLDLYLPNRQDGLSLLESIRYFLSINKLPEVPVIVFSYSNHKKDINACYALQANAYMVKPPDASQWPLYFKGLAHFWSKTIHSPAANR
jgi:CheY-like chemotaxis protein